LTTRRHPMGLRLLNAELWGETTFERAFREKFSRVEPCSPTPGPFVDLDRPVPPARVTLNLSEIGRRCIAERWGMP
jgi:hypothetical protein